MCTCYVGYSGNNCEIIKDTCNPNQCLNAGSCIVKWPFYQCQCLPGNYVTNKILVVYFLNIDETSFTSALVIP